MFNGVKFTSWKERMEIFLQFIDIELYYIVYEGLY